MGYFRQLPDFNYVSRLDEKVSSTDYVQVKNLFRRGALRPDIADNLLFFTKYSIIGDERPDNVAFKFYEDESLDWVVLLSNNIVNVQSEWPLPQRIFDKVMLEKYGTYENFYNGIHHYETKEVRNSLGKPILKSGLPISNVWETGGGFVKDTSTTPTSYYYEYYDPGTSSTERVFQDKLLTPITFYDYENQLENEKRNML